MAFDPLAPAPRLPEDLTVVSGRVSLNGNLEAMLCASPDASLTHVSLVQTRTPDYWASSAYLEVYHKPITTPFPTPAEADAAADIVMTMIDKPSPRP